MQKNMDLNSIQPLVQKWTRVCVRVCKMITIMCPNYIRIGLFILDKIKTNSSSFSHRINERLAQYLVGLTLKDQINFLIAIKSMPIKELKVL